MGKRIRAQRKGRSSRYRVNSHRFPGKIRLPDVKNEVVEVVELIHSAVHTAPLAKLRADDGSETFVSATAGIAVGQTIAVGDKVSLKPGNVTVLRNIPEGTPVNNIELRPGDGGKIARSAGNSALIESHLDGKVRIKLPSGKSKVIHANCRATIGVLGGHGRTEMPLMTAGAAHYRAKARGKAYPTVSGVKMNPVDHPHGGGNHQAVHGPNSVARGASPGSKVGHIAPSRTGRGRGKRKK